MKEEQIQAALDRAAIDLSPFFHSTAEELEKIFATLLTLDLLGLSFVGLMNGICSHKEAEKIRLCREFASSTISSESAPLESTTPSTQPYK